MKPHDFLSKWRKVELKERSASQSHFNDLCRLLEIDDPIRADPTGEWFTFEKGATKTSGGDGWADVWRKGCFAWEYKGRAANLHRAFDQLLRYSIALESPPLLIVSDMDRIRIHTNWTNTVQQIHEIALEDLVDASKRSILRSCFEDPEKLRPSKTRQALTEEAAREFASLAQRLRDRGHGPHQVAHFINRLVFCMFAEDIGLLPSNMFLRMLEASRSDARHFATHATTLFAAMRSGGMVGFEKVEWFNGGLFDDESALPVEDVDIKNLLAAARLDWSEIDPSILGTLFERGLDPAKRSQLGAHYTDREKIMQIVRPVVVEPLEREWDGIRVEIEKQADKIAEARARVPATQTEARKVYAAARRAEELAFRTAKEHHAKFIERLRNFRVLDPACGSGNFLYLSLLTLKDVEHKANLDAEALGLGRFAPSVGPENVLGIELNSYAAELARVSVWIGEIQWMRRNGFDAARNPVLRTLNNIECRDAVLSVDGKQPQWPSADVVVGNPPFLGNKKMIGELGEDYTLALRKAWPGVSGGVDLVCYWFAKAWSLIESGKLTRAGLVSTNSIRAGANREVLKKIVEGGRILEAWSDEPWFDERGAAVRVSMVCFDSLDGLAKLDGVNVLKVHPDLKSGAADSSQLRELSENAGCSFVGVILNGEGFELDGATARRLISSRGNPNGRPNSDVLKPTLNGDDFNGSRPDKWVIDFGTKLSEEDASLYEKPFQHVLSLVKPYRQRVDEDGEYVVRAKGEREKWWLHARSRPAMRTALSGLDKYIATPMVTSYRNFGFLSSSVLPDQKLVVFNRNDFTFLGILESKFHYIWTLATCSWIGTGNDITYAKVAVFETFPFPSGLTPNLPSSSYLHDPHAQAIAVAAERLNELREGWLRPSDLVIRTPEVGTGYPARIQPVDQNAASELAQRTLSDLYLNRPQWLDRAHQAVDEAVATAYGWGEDFQAGTLTDDVILERLFALNKSRANGS
ncbi:class I SAM-dependent DNA methyltransferase [Rhizobium ruizarguesonis]|uniref:class I SAM-dependent DNA methyltransferase n=1 Tax=Rhizobium ruizarguesonis TaxID=2081791 RepID=UPI00103261A2|nr:DNA methyltransferase [Rhizobium ruizarguesonis]TAY73535.1 class I SAM-dependent DNA methyltransferase [Rhizobium ruizarguesonis]